MGLILAAGVAVVWRLRARWQDARQAVPETRIAAAEAERDTERARSRVLEQERDALREEKDRFDRLSREIEGAYVTVMREPGGDGAAPEALFKSLRDRVLVQVEPFAAARAQIDLIKRCLEGFAFTSESPDEAVRRLRDEHVDVVAILNESEADRPAREEQRKAIQRQYDEVRAIIAEGLEHGAVLERARDLEEVMRVIQGFPRSTGGTFEARLRVYVSVLQERADHAAGLQPRIGELAQAVEAANALASAAGLRADEAERREREAVNEAEQRRREAVNEAERREREAVDQVAAREAREKAALEHVNKLTAWAGISRPITGWEQVADLVRALPPRGEPMAEAISGLSASVEKLVRVRDGLKEARRDLFNELGMDNVISGLIILREKAPGMTAADLWIKHLRPATWVHPLFRAEAVLDAYFDRVRDLFPLRDAARDAAIRVRAILDAAGAGFEPAPLFAPPPANVRETTYEMPDALAQMSEVRARIVERLQAGDDFVIDVRTFRLSYPNGGGSDVRLVVVNRAQWEDAARRAR